MTYWPFENLHLSGLNAEDMRNVYIVIIRITIIGKTWRTWQNENPWKGLNLPIGHKTHPELLREENCPGGQGLHSDKEDA